MTNSPTTRVSLLVRIRDRDDVDAWSEFIDLYAPLVYALARRRGLQEADASDLTQDVLRAVARTAPHFAYDPTRGSFRGWLFTVARNQLRKWANQRRRQPLASGSADDRRLLEEQPARADEGDFWEEEYRSRLFAWASERVRPAFRPSTWEAFWQTAVEAREPSEVAAALGLTVGAVYIARSRVLARLREHVQQVQDSYPLGASGS
jgi:RNA polymerase sigma-70 factor (ECF subfamily)